MSAVTTATTRSTASSKAWATLAARAALSGYTLWRSDPDDGVQRFFAGRHGIVRPLADLDAVSTWLDDLDGHNSLTARAGKG